MDCKKCSRFMFFGDAEICDPCRKEQIKMDGLKTYYKDLKEYSLKYAVLDCRRQGFTFRKIAFILDRDINEVSHAWDRLTQDAS